MSSGREQRDAHRPGRRPARSSPAMRNEIERMPRARPFLQAMQEYMHRPVSERLSLPIRWFAVLEECAL